MDDDRFSLMLRLLVGAALCYLLASDFRNSHETAFFVLLALGGLFELGFWITIFGGSRAKGASIGNDQEDSIS